MNNRIKILLVEDEKMLAEILSDTLSDRNFDVHLAYDGIHALEVIKKEPFDVIVSDVMMPNLDGYSLAKKLRNEGFNTPILFLTALSATEDVVKGFETEEPRLGIPKRHLMLLGNMSLTHRRRS